MVSVSTDWTNSHLELPLDSGHFYRHPEGGDWEPSPAQISSYPALRWHSYVTVPGGYPSIDPDWLTPHHTIGNSHFSPCWFDVHRTGPGTFKIAQFTASTGSSGLGLVISFNANPGSGEPDMEPDHPFGIDIPSGFQTAQDYYVGSWRAQQGVAYHAGNFYTSSGDGMILGGSLSMYDSSLEHIKTVNIGVDLHVGDIAVDDTYVYAPVRSPSKPMSIARYSRSTLSYVDDWPVWHFADDIAGLDWDSGVLWAVEHKTLLDGNAHLYTFDVDDLSNPIAVYEITSKYANGVEVVPNEFGWNTILVSCGDVFQEGRIEAYDLASLSEGSLNEPASLETFPVDYYPWHAEGLTFDDNGTLYVAQGDYVKSLESRLGHFGDYPVPEPATLALLALGAVAVLRRRSAQVMRRRRR